MRRATDLLQMEKRWVGVNCLAHILQLCISDGFKNNAAINRTLFAVHKLVGYFHHSTLATAEQYKTQSQMNMHQQKLEMDSTTRWNSTLYMIQHLVTNRWPVSALLSDTSVTKRQDRTHNLTAQQWVLREELTKLLESLEVAAVFFAQREKYQYLVFTNNA